MTAQRILLTAFSVFLLTGAGCGGPEATFDRFVEEFRTKYAEVVTAGDELVSVSGAAEVHSGIRGTLKYTVRRRDEAGASEDVVMQVDYEFRDGEWRLVRSFPLYEGDMRDIHRERSKQERVSGLLIEISDD